MYKTTYLIIPVYNEAQVIRGVIESALKVFPNIICVDDGSTDESAREIQQTGAIYVQHPVNMGQGGALQTGLEYALLDPAAEYFVTFDADGQHRLTDAQKMVDELKKGEYNIALGSRFLSPGGKIPRLKKIILTAATWATNLMTGTHLTDTHNGLRAFDRKFAGHLEITMPDMTHGTEIIIIIGESGMKYLEMPVTIDYTEYSKSKGQSILNAVNILFDLGISGRGRKK
jgi:polyprenyl-phospho-N-acetylgalactosaminyl synthase